MSSISKDHKRKLTIISDLEMENKKLKLRIKYEDGVIYYANEYVNFLHESLVNYIIQADRALIIVLDDDFKNKYITEYNNFLEKLKKLEK